VAGDDKNCFVLKVPADGGLPVRLADGINADPVWSPDGKVILYSAAKGGPFLQLRGVTPEGRPVPVPDVTVLYIGNRYRYMPDGKSCVVVRGDTLGTQNFWLLELATGRMRQLTNLRPGPEMRSFDVSYDGRTILFDRYRSNSDIVLIDLPPR
jgi:Tol biopolymer transport system component